MNKLFIPTIASIIGLATGGMSMYAFMETRISKRVKNEVEVTELRGDLSRGEERLLELKGRVWTLERQFEELAKQHAVHEKGHPKN